MVPGGWRAGDHSFLPGGDRRVWTKVPRKDGPRRRTMGWKGWIPMGKEPANASRPRWPFRRLPMLLLLVLLLAALPGAAAAAQSGPVPMGIIVQPEPHDLQVRIETDRNR